MSKVFFIEDRPVDVQVDVRDYEASYEPIELLADEFGTLIDSPEVFMYYDGTPIAMVNIHILLSTLRRVYDVEDVQALIDLNPSLSLRELLSFIGDSGVNISVLVATLTIIYGHSTTSELMEENPTFHLNDLTTILYRYGAR